MADVAGCAVRPGITWPGVAGCVWVRLVDRGRWQPVGLPATSRTRRNAAARRKPRDLVSRLRPGAHFLRPDGDPVRRLQPWLHGDIGRAGQAARVAEAVPLAGE